MPINPLCCPLRCRACNQSILVEMVVPVAPPQPHPLNQLCKDSSNTAHAAFLAPPSTIPARLVKAKTLSILREKFGRNKRRVGCLRNTGSYYQEKSSIVSNFKFSYLFNIAYKHQGNGKHKDMQSLVGVHIKNEAEEVGDDGAVLHPFMLIFPNKRRVYYLKSKASFFVA